LHDRLVFEFYFVFKHVELLVVNKSVPYSKVGDFLKNALNPNNKDIIFTIASEAVGFFW
jgi:hypothetical protein